MIFLIILFFIVSLSIARFTIRDSFSKKILYLFLSWWGIALTLSNFNLSELYVVSNKTYVLLLLNVFCFFIGYTVIGKIYTVRKITNTSKSFDSFVSKNWVLRFLLIVSILITYYYAKKFAAIVEFHGAGDGRMTRFEVGELFSSNIEIYVYDYLILPFSQYIMLIIACLFVSKIKWQLLLLSLVFLFLFGLVGNGRAVFIVILFYCILIFLLRKELYSLKLLEEKSLSFGFKKKILMILSSFVGIIIIISLVAFMTAQRMGYNELTQEVLVLGLNELANQTVWYFLGPFRALDYSFTQNYSEITGFWYGRATLGGFDSLIKLFIHGFGGNYEIANQTIGHLLQETKIQVGNGITFNYAYTNLIFHYLDFGYAGIMIFPLFFGMIVRTTILKLLNTPTIPLLALTVYMIYVSLFNIFSWEFQKASAAVYVIALFMMHYFFQHKFTFVKKNI